MARFTLGEGSAIFTGGGKAEVAQSRPTASGSASKAKRISCREGALRWSVTTSVGAKEWVTFYYRSRTRDDAAARVRINQHALRGTELGTAKRYPDLPRWVGGKAEQRHCAARSSEAAQNRYHHETKDGNIKKSPYKVLAPIKHQPSPPKGRNETKQCAKPSTLILKSPTPNA